MRSARKRTPFAPWRATLAVAGLTLVLSPASAPLAQDGPLFTAMQDEMQRSMSELRMQGEPAPYYIHYRIDDLSSMRAVARLGGIVDDLVDRSRTLEVQVRVGDYMFDSSRFVTQDRGAGGVPQSGLPAPLDDNYDAIRQQLWLTTDAAQTRSGVFAKKKALLNRAEVADVLRISREAPVVTLNQSPTPARRVGRARRALIGIRRTQTRRFGNLAGRGMAPPLPNSGIQDGRAGWVSLPSGYR